jgi:hypothetical protein
MVIMMLLMLERNVMNEMIGKQMVATLVESAANVEISYLNRLFKLIILNSNFNSFTFFLYIKV